MKILIVNSSDTVGGAARAAYRLHKALLAYNIDSNMWVMSKNSDDFTVHGSQSKWKKLFNKLRPILDRIPVYKYDKSTLFSTALIPSISIVNDINRLNPDIVHLHWINAGMLKIEDIEKINAPIVWTLHDNWAFTGGCHIMWDCNKYQSSCGKCPKLGSRKNNDLSRKVFNRKLKAFAHIEQLSLIAPSQWLANCVSKSTLLKNRTIINLPNPLDITRFKPFDSERAKELWNLPNNKKLILFGANSATSDINKGYFELIEALRKIKDTTQVELVIFGSGEPQVSQDFNFKAHYLGHVHDDVSLQTIYSAVDVMVVPSLQEAFGQTASESMACGTPVVAFGHTGLLDIVDHKVNGYLAHPFDTSDLAHGIEWVIHNDNYEQLSLSSRNKVLRKFDSNIVAEKHVEYYRNILEDR